MDKALLASLIVRKTWKDGSWTLHEVEVDEATACALGKHLAPGPWYLHFWESGGNAILVVFRERHFWIEQSDRSTWTDAIEFGKHIGIPEEQLDFLTS